jgi:hypothetical protein
VRGVGGNDRPGQVVRDILTELAGCIRELQGGPAYDPDLLTRLYLLRDITAEARVRGVGQVAVAEWINRAAMLIRDENGREQALRLLRLAQDQLTTGTATPRQQ